MRIVYLDESGIGKIEHDPVLVVAGVVIHADMHWLKLQAEPRSLLEDATPVGVKVPSALHAKDIWHGSREFDRKLWPMQVRCGLLDELSKIPAKYQLPVVWGALSRKRYRKVWPDQPPKEVLIGTYTVASLACMMMAEEYMRYGAPEDEVASIVFEHNSDLQKYIPKTYEFARSPEKVALMVDAEQSRHFPFTRIIDTPTFQQKTESSILQVADFCAFAIKRYEQGAKEAAPWYDMMAPMFVRYRKRPALEQD